MSHNRRFAGAAILIAGALIVGLTQPALSTSSEISTKRCVGQPPRQTEDPQSPACIAFYSGDNGGATYQGVTADEIRVVIRLDGGTTYVSAGGVESVPPGTFYDLGVEPEADEPSPVTAARAYQLWFNDRYQTFGRRVHMYVHTSDPSHSPEAARGEAADIFVQVQPFAVVDATSYIDDAFAAALAKKGVVTVSDLAAGSAVLARSYPGLVWATQPSTEVAANLYTSFVCSHPSYAGTRRALMMRSEGNRLHTQGQLVKTHLAECGVSVLHEVTFGDHGSAVNASTPPSTEAITTMRNLQSDNVDTILVGGGYDARFGQAAAALGYFPKWVLAGDGVSEGAGGPRYQTSWLHATIVAANLDPSPWGAKPCDVAFDQASASWPLSPEARARSCHQYLGLRLLFNGIQTAGPSLTPAQFNLGLHAIPARPGAPSSPACFFNADDYSCTKDAAVAHWDSFAPPASRPGDVPLPGCWRMAAGGQRSLVGSWNRPVDQGPNDPCSTYQSDVRVSFGPSG